MSSDQGASGGVKVFRQGPVGHLLLSSAHNLNALSLEMVVALHEGLLQHESDEQVFAILIRSESDRAFCAGGEMKTLRRLAIDERFDEIDGFFEREYELNLRIATCEKPFIALLDGITMGGGLGISVHGSFQVATQNTVMAMPETRIGFFPDVGASYFLQRLKRRAGYWLGLTSLSVRAQETVAVGLASHFIPAEDLTAMLSALTSALESTDAGSVEAWHRETDRTLAQFCQYEADEVVTATLDYRANWFADNDLRLIRDRLRSAMENDGIAEGTAQADARNLLHSLDTGSPYSTKITVELFEQTKTLSLRECLELERSLAAVACRHPDFIEGIRAVLVDKDRQPVWQPQDDV